MCQKNTIQSIKHLSFIVSIYQVKFQLNIRRNGQVVFCLTLTFFFVVCRYKWCPIKMITRCFKRNLHLSDLSCLSVSKLQIEILAILIITINTSNYSYCHINLTFRKCTSINLLHCLILNPQQHLDLVSEKHSPHSHQHQYFFTNVIQHDGLKLCKNAQ